jgi:hypothetical protein
MNPALPLFLAGALVSSQALAQTTDVGLTMDGGMLTVLYGQACGPVGCQPFPGGAVGQGQTRTLIHYGAPVSLYVIAAGLPAPCAAIPGIDNVLMLANPIVLGFGLTSAPPFVPTPCQQGLAHQQLVIPPTAPIGVTFRLQSLGFGNSGALALGPAIETTIL